MKSEAVVQSEIRAAAGARGILLWRNNVGACKDDTGRIIRYGLGNDSAQVQRRLKSSDLIGLVKMSYDTHHGDTELVGRFLAVECKAEGWTFPKEWRDKQPSEIDATNLKDDKLRTLAQWRYLTVVWLAGGLAGFAQSPADFDCILGGELGLP